MLGEVRSLGQGDPTALTCPAAISSRKSTVRLLLTLTAHFHISQGEQSGACSGPDTTCLFT